MLMLLAAAFFALLAVVADSPPFPSLFFVYSPAWHFRAGLTLGFIALLLRYAPPAVGIFAVFATNGLITLVLGLTAYQIFSGQNCFYTLLRKDPKFGLMPIPDTRQPHWYLPDFAVKYSFDHEGWRVMPTPAEPRGEILFLGCSYTFGIGVRDQQTYPWLLASGPWRRYRVRNYSQSAWGTGKDYLALINHLQERSEPKLVLYGWIRDHLRRNYRRQSWYAQMLSPEPWLNTIPSFEVESGQLVQKGIIPLSEALEPDTPGTDQMEIEVSLALIDEMKRVCDDRNISFFVLLLSQKGPRDVPDPVADVLESRGVPVIDARSVLGPFFERDTHPRAGWHEEVAPIVQDHPAIRALGL